MIRHSVRWPSLALLVGVFGLLASFAVGAGSARLPAGSLFSGSASSPSVNTDLQGAFRFDGLHSSSHLLRLDVQTLPPEVRPFRSSIAMTLSPGVTQSLPVAPGVVLRASYHDDGNTIDGALFFDRDGDGRQEPGEPGLPDVRIIDPDVYQYFVPFNDDHLYQSFADVLGSACLNDPNVSTTIASTISLTASSPATTVYYDQWEDGYDADPTVPGPTTQVIVIGAGQTQLWQNNENIPRSPAVVRRDGRDRITIIGQPASAVRAAWLTQPGTVLAGAWEMPRVSDWGRRYVIPVGENIGRRGPQSYGDYDYVSAEVMAAYDNTVVQIDANADGAFETTQTINAGQTLYIRGTANQAPGVFAIRSGAQVSASLPVQVQVRAGNCRAPYSGRSYSLVPVERWTNDYWSPVSSFFTGANGCVVRYLNNQPNTAADVDIYIFNPNNAALPVTYEDASGTGVITIPPLSTGSYLNLHPKPMVRSNTQGVHLTAPGSFSAVTAVDSTSLGNDGADFDWSYTLVPSVDLSSRVVLSWAPGNALAPPTGQINGSTVYIQAVANGTVVKADLNGDGLADPFDTDGNGTLSAVSAYGYNELTSATAGIVLNRGQMVRVSNPMTHNMTGATIFSQDNAHPLAAVYGEDACVAGPQSPFLDLGYTVLPLPIPEFTKSAQLFLDADRSGDVSPGDTLKYTVQAYNNGVVPIQQPVIIDTLPYTYTSFVIGSIVSTGPIVGAQPTLSYDNGSGTFTYVPVGAPGTPDPQIHAFKASAYPTLDRGQTILITFLVQLHAQIPPAIRSLTNYAQLTSSNTPPKSSQVITPINQVDLLIHKDDGQVNVRAGQALTYTITYTNAGPGIAHNVVMTDTLPPTAINVSSPAVPGVITPTIQPGRIIFQLGTLVAGQVGQTHVSLTLGSNTPTPGSVVNSITISTSSSETNTGNNSSTDIDNVPTAVVLSEFRAFRQPGGVVVRWRTLAEQDNYGFRVYRGTTPNRASAALITPAVIPAQGRGRAAGAIYSIFDASPPGGTLYYWLEDIDLHGASSFHGPAVPTLQSTQYTYYLPLIVSTP